MFSPEISYMVTQEQYKDRLRNIEKQQLIRAARLQQTINRNTHRKAVGWLGTQLVKWGSKLQNYEMSASSDTFMVET